MEDEIFEDEFDDELLDEFGGRVLQDEFIIEWPEYIAGIPD